ncbi:hypothetical protein J6253_03430 [bacterium]|nr:hypothetical protein [bacterium]MBP5591431.1 hypothetical protein [bacterium]
MKTNTEKFKDLPFKECIARLEEISEQGITEETTADLRLLIKDLIKSNRLFDISSLYVFLKNAAATDGRTGIFFEPAKEMLLDNIKNLFARSITYNNTELRRMFSDILGCNNALIIDLVSFIFNKYDLFNVTFSDNINRQLLQIAQNDLTGFINNANSKFLAFYLSSLSKIGFVPKEHIEQITKMIICGIDSQKQTSKILDAMQVHPSADILLIFILSQRENDRLRALQILKEKLAQENAEELRASFADKSPYFIRAALTNPLFYDFNNIPLAHKELFASILKYTDIKIIRETVLPIMRKANTENDPVITESKLSFVPAFRDLLPVFSDLGPELTKILKDEKIELEVKEDIRKLLLEFK